MSAARFILRMVVFVVTLLVVGTIAVLGFTVVEPFFTALGEPSPASWGTPASSTVTFAAVGLLGMLLVLIIWFVSAPIRRDRRQQFRR